MPLLGDLSTMSLVDLLLWVGRNDKTGVLELEQHRVARRVEFRKGWIGACSSSDPASRLGQFLIARGRLTEEQLTEALTRQRTVRKNLGWILNDMDVLSRKDLARLISLKAEETMYGLFEWQDAVFRFNEGATLDPDHIVVSLSVNDILEKGQRRLKDLEGIRAVFPSAGIVLGKQKDRADGLKLDSAMGQRILDAVDGQRSIAELRLHTNASEFALLKFLYGLHGKGVIEICEERPVDGDATTMLGRGRPRTKPWRGIDLKAIIAPQTSETDAPDDAADVLGELNQELAVAERLLARGETGVAMEVLNAVYRARPEVDAVREALAQIEQQYVETLRTQQLSFDRVPVQVAEVEAVQRELLRPEETYVLDLIDGESDIQAMLWITPMREIDVLVALRRLLDRGLIAISGR